MGELTHPILALLLPTNKWSLAHASALADPTYVSTPSPARKGIYAATRIEVECDISEIYSPVTIAHQPVRIKATTALYRNIPHRTTPHHTTIIKYRPSVRRHFSQSQRQRTQI